MKFLEGGPSSRLDNFRQRYRDNKNRKGRKSFFIPPGFLTKADPGSKLSVGPGGTLVNKDVSAPDTSGRSRIGSLLSSLNRSIGSSLGRARPSQSSISSAHHVPTTSALLRLEPKSGSSDKPSPKPKDAFLPRKIRKRLVNKSGTCNVIHSHIPKLKQHFLTDIYTTLLDSKWRWSIIVFATSFLASWFGYAFIWWLILFSHDDFDHLTNPNWKPCVKNVESFAGVFLFSVETQHTIGYGYRYITEECPEAIIMLIIQAITGAMIQGFVTGMIFAKLCRPKKRAATLMFSRNAVICTRDGQLCLCVRLGDMRTSHMIGATTKAYLFRKKATLEGEIIHLNPYEMKVGTCRDSDNIFLVWPVIVSHIIDETSPFYDMGAQELHDEHFEMVFIFQGMIEATGATMQARTSYLPHEILWGYRFERLTRFITETGNLAINYTNFHLVTPVNIPRCSSRTLESLRKKYFEEEKRLKELALKSFKELSNNQTSDSMHQIHTNADGESVELIHLLNRALVKLDKLDLENRDGENKYDENVPIFYTSIATQTEDDTQLEPNN